MVKKNSVRSGWFIVGLAGVMCFWTGISCKLDNSHITPVTISLTAEPEVNRKILEQFVPEPFILEKLTFESDLYLQPSEFFYLVGFNRGDTVDSESLESALSYICKKKKFESVKLSREPCSHGEHLHFSLTGLWTLSKCTIKGVLVGRDTYQRYYLMEPGDSFDEQRHRDSIAKIIDMLKKEGYFNARVDDNISYNKQTKSVSSTLTISKGNRFSIGSVTLRLHGFPSQKEDELDFLHLKLTKQFLNNLRKKDYSRLLINQETAGIKRYLSHHGFLQVSIVLDEQIDYISESVNLFFTITVRHKREFVFFGNHFFSNNRLLDTIMVFERSVWLLPFSILVDEIRKLYHDKGFWNVNIEPREEDDRVFFVITEGQRISIKEVVFEGLAYCESRRLIKQCFMSLLRASYFDRQLLKESISKLTAFYLKEGFWDVKVLQTRFDPVDENKYTYRLIVTIDEGARRYISSVSIPDLPEINQKGPFKVITRKRDKIPFDMTMLYEQKKWLANYCKSKGMADVSITYDLVSDGADVSVVWHIKRSHEGIRLGKTILLGSSTFPFEYVTREFQYKEGDEWDRQKINKTLSRFKEMELFETVHAYPDRDIQEDNTQNVMLKLRENDPFELRIRAGFGIEQISKPVTIGDITYKIGGAFIVKNPLNCGDLFCFNADVARSHRSIIIQYKRPWLLDMPFRTVVQGYSSKYQQPGFFFCKKGLYEVSQNGILFGLGRSYKWLDGNITLGFEWMELNVQKEFRCVADCVAQAIDFDIRLLNKNMPFLFVEPTLLIDCLDNKLNPVRGSLTLLSCKGMLPITERVDRAAFFKLMAEQSFFIPFMPLVIALRLRFGHIFYQTFNNINPIERFYLGGANSLRSYDTDVAPPLGTFCDPAGKWWWAPMGGKTMVNANLEARFPIYGDIGAVIFQDLGALSSSGIKGFGKKGLLAGTGFGVRYNTPIGPLRFDIGWKWSVCKPFDRSYAWFLTFGNAF